MQLKTISIARSTTWQPRHSERVEISLTAELSAGDDELAVIDDLKALAEREVQRSRDEITFRAIQAADQEAGQ